WVEQWPLSQPRMDALLKLVDRELQQEHIEPSTSPWNTPIFVIPKRSGEGFRLLHDLREVNKNIQPMGAVQTLLPMSSMIPKGQPCATLDIKDCFFSIPLHEADEEKCTFSLVFPNNQQPNLRFQWKVLPQGMLNSPTICQIVIDRALAPIRHNNPATTIIQYMDDILIAAPSRDQLPTKSIALSKHLAIALARFNGEIQYATKPPWTQLLAIVDIDLPQKDWVIGRPQNQYSPVPEENNTPTNTLSNPAGSAQTKARQHRDSHRERKQQCLCVILILALSKVFDKSSEYCVQVTVIPKIYFHPESYVYDSMTVPDHHLTKWEPNIALTVALTWKSTDPVWVEQWPLSQPRMDALLKLVDRELQQEHIEPSTSPWNTPIFVIHKQSGEGFRLLHDLREVNKKIQPMGAVQTLLPMSSMTPKGQPCATLDIKDCFFSIPLHEGDKEKFTFSLVFPNNQQPNLRFQWKVLPQGMLNSPTICQIVIDRALEPIRHNNPATTIIQYMDDILIAAPSGDQLPTKSIALSEPLAIALAGFNGEIQYATKPPWTQLLTIVDIDLPQKVMDRPQPGPTVFTDASSVTSTAAVVWQSENEWHCDWVIGCPQNQYSPVPEEDDTPTNTPPNPADSAQTKARQHRDSHRFL
ncbi:uncharacterized protein LOC114072918, partial [Empidonax traillii]|uniref:uncharacterized protein LOC114072918 n=1 Tax=Empidonax traillii TaxID=164674 RepID=UPI000FFD0CCD